MYDKEILLELILAINCNLSENELLDKTLRFYIEKLNCEAAYILTTNKKIITKTVNPKSLSQTSEVNHISHYFKKDSTKKHFETYPDDCIIYNDEYYYVYKLLGYGFAVFVKSEKFSLDIQQNLNLIFQFYGMALSNSKRLDENQRIEKELEDEKMLLRTIIDNIPVEIKVENLKGTSLLSNSVSFGDKSIINEVSQSSLNGKHNLNKDYFLNEEFATKTNKNSLNSRILLKNSDDSSSVIISTAIDITKSKEEENKLWFFKKMINETSDAIIILEENNHLTYCNQVALEWLELSCDNYEGKSIFELKFTLIDQRDLESFLESIDIDTTVSTEAYIENTLSEKPIHLEIKANKTYFHKSKIISLNCRDITEKKYVESQVKKEIQIQDLLIKIANTYININLDKIELNINKSLEEIGSFVDADRSYIFEYDKELKTCSNTFEWCSEGISPEIDNLQLIPTADIPDWIEQHEKGLPFLVEDVELLPEGGEFSLKTILKSQGIKSLITLPMVYEDNLIGFIGFDSVKTKRNYSKKERSLLALFAQILVNINLRKEDQEKLVRQENKYKTLLDNVEVGLIEVDNEFNVEYINETHSKLFGYHLSEIKNKNSFEFLLEKEKEPEVRRLFNELKPNQNINFEIEALTKHKEVKNILTSAGAKYDSDGKKTGLIAAFLDNTYQKNIEIELKKAKENAEKESKEKERFLANMSHEMRTPLNVINGTVNELINYEQDILIQNDLLKQTKSASDYLLSLVNNVLDLAKINAGELHFEKEVIDLKEVCHNSFQILKFQAKEKNNIYKFSFDEDLEDNVIFDATKISQILINFLSNALKFTQNGYVSLMVKLINENHEHYNVRFQIEDDGVGMEKHFLKRMFNEFSIENKTFGGTGLGMPISKKLIELMGGEIKVTSEKNKGTTISFDITITKSISKLPDNHKIDRPSILKNQKILVVEDNDMNALIFKKQLERKKAKVFVQRNGEDALEFIKKEGKDCDLILMDIQMPVMDGIECTNIIREKLKLKIPIIAVTANVFKSDLDFYISIGINNIITKPCSEEDLIFKCCKELNLFYTKQSMKDANKNNLNINYDFKKLEKIAQGDLEFIKKLLETFLLLIDEANSNLKKAIKEKNIILVKSILHKIKTSILDLGLAQIYELINKIESCDLFESCDTEVCSILRSLELLEVKVRSDIEHI
ncbi:ATP-binding protein [Psychroflexus aestuariivivens]|uniref:ATP-binding protein n=1 Tax=Psychroflexus aestuariivivens TaxID=1795040 RepID=UPI001863D799|nr:ATP-binding protein [Psychroflexus aestuariivivens]